MCWRKRLLTLLDGGAGAEGDALASAAVDDGLDAGELGLVDAGGGLLHAGEGADGGQHLEDGLHAHTQDDEFQFGFLR